MKKYLLIALLPLFAWSCSSDEPGGGTPQQAKKIELTGSESRAAAAANDFGERFFAEVCAQEEGTIVTSPFSAAMALGQLANGADQEAADEIANVLGFADLASLNSFSQKMYAAMPTSDPQVQLALANGVWYDNQVTLQKPFSEALREYYDTEIRQQDISSANSTIQKDINSWVSAKTKNLIQSMKVERDELLRVLILNALYFKGTWSEPFDAKLTAPATFHGLGGEATVEMMHTKDQYSYYESGECEAVKIAFGRGGYYATIVLPAKGKTEKDVPALKDMDFESYEVDLSLPKFDTEELEEIQLTGILKDMGIKKVFDPQHQCFLNESIELYLKVKQKATLKVDEEGAEAAAVSMIGISGAILTEGKAVMTVDRPFLFYITEASTGTLLFAARITDI